MVRPRLVLGVDLLAPARAGVPDDDGRLRAVLGEDLHEHRGEAEDRVRRKAGRGRDRLGQREERPVDERVAVDEEELVGAVGHRLGTLRIPSPCFRRRRYLPRRRNIDARKRDMSLTYTCNFCGETIDRERPVRDLNGNGERSARLLADRVRRPLPRRPRGRLLEPDPRGDSPARRAAAGRDPDGDATRRSRRGGASTGRWTRRRDRRRARLSPQRPSGPGRCPGPYARVMRVTVTAPRGASAAISSQR